MYSSLEVGSQALEQTRRFRLRAEAALRRRCQRRETAAYNAEEEKKASQPTVQPVNFVVEAGTTRETVQVLPDATIDEVKRSVEVATGHPAARQCVYIDGKPRLSGMSRLSTFKVRDTQSMRVAVRETRDLQIFIVDPSRGETFPLDVTPDQTVSAIKAVIEDLSGSPQELTMLELDGKVLHGDTVLKATGVRKGSTLLLRSGLHSHRPRPASDGAEEEPGPGADSGPYAPEEFNADTEHWQQVTSDALLGSTYEDPPGLSYPENLPWSAMYKYRRESHTPFPVSPGGESDGYSVWSGAVTEEE